MSHGRWVVLEDKRDYDDQAMTLSLLLEISRDLLQVQSGALASFTRI